PRLPVILSRRQQLLRNPVFHRPGFRSVMLWAETDHHHLEERLIGWKVNLAPELCYQRPELLQKGDPNHFQIGICLSVVGGFIAGIAPRGNTLKVSVHPDGIWIGQRTPLGSSKKNSDVLTIQIHDAGRWCSLFDGLVNGGKKDDLIFCNMKDDPA